MNIRIAGTVNDSIVDGPGCRYTVFTQGCPHHCPGCHNPESHDFAGGRDADTNLIITQLRENPLLDGLTQAAEIIGAVNTVVVRDGKWIGENTDGKGFVRALQKELICLEGKQVTILGAGGAARAISVECALAGAASITVINRSEKNGTELTELLNTHTPAKARYLPWTAGMAIPADTQILVNATCVGLHPNVTDKPDIDYTTIRPEMVVCDVVFNPVDPVFLQEARKQGAKTVSGIGMLVQQGALAFTLWTGKEAPEQVMYDTLAKEFEA